ncbi:MAG TPA: SAM-dependent methyltransferase [Mycobacteriales bacterium]
MRYALLVSPAANRVYAAAAVGLTVAELGVAALGPLAASGVAAERIAGVPYVTFEAEEPDLATLGLLSSAQALFEVHGDLLRPVGLPRPDVLDEDLTTIPKYPGKTNEQFTRLLLNVTLLSSTRPSSPRRRQLRVLDPLCGRGTTLNQALVYGFDAAGIDADGRDLAAYAAFLRTWLQRKRLKHRIEFTPVKENRRVIARRLHATVADPPVELTAYAADTVAGMRFFGPDSVDLVVADAPYGVQHGSRAGGRLARGPVDLLADAVPAWTRALRPGGAMGIAWNANVADRASLERILAGAGLTVLDAEPYHGFRHRVDQSILRDLVVATRPDPP